MTTEAIKRITAYIERRRKACGIDIESIHGFDVGADSEAELRLSDLVELVGLVKVQAPSDSAGPYLDPNYDTTLHFKVDDEAWTEDQIADACMAAEIPDSKFEALMISLQETKQ